MSSEETLVAGVAGRYATALFELALEVEKGSDPSLQSFSSQSDGSVLDAVADDLRNLQGMLNDSADLRHLVMSPVFDRDEQGRALGAVTEKAGLGLLTRNFIGLVANNRRLFALEGMIKAYGQLLARHRGEISATVTSAFALKDNHVTALKTSLKEALGRDVQLETRVDEALLGGLVVKVGSRMIDSSLATKLNNLKIAMKEVG